MAKGGCALLTLVLCGAALCVLPKEKIKREYARQGINMPLPPIPSPTPTPRPSIGWIEMGGLEGPLPAKLTMNSVTGLRITLSIPSTGTTTVQLSLSDQSACSLSQSELKYLHDEQNRTVKITCTKTAVSPFTVSAQQSAGNNTYEAFTTDEVVVGVPGEITVRSDRGELSQLVVGSVVPLALHLSEPSVGRTQIAVAMNGSKGNCEFQVDGNQQWQSAAMVWCEDDATLCQPLHLRCSAAAAPAPLLARQMSGVNDYSPFSSRPLQVKAGLRLTVRGCCGGESCGDLRPPCGGGLPAVVKKGTQMTLSLRLPLPPTGPLQVNVQTDSPHGNCSFSLDGAQFAPQLDLGLGPGTNTRDLVMMCRDISYEGTNVRVQDPSGQYPAFSKHVQVGFKWDSSQLVFVGEQGVEQHTVR